MDAWTAGADAGAMATGLSAVTAAYVFIMGRWRAWRDRRAETAHRNWHGYIPLNGVDTWHVRLVEDPPLPIGTVVLEVLDSSDGDPAPNLAHNMRQVILRDGTLSRAPSTEEYAFLKHLYQERGYGKGFPIR